MIKSEKINAVIFIYAISVYIGIFFLLFYVVFLMVLS